MIADVTVRIKDENPYWHYTYFSQFNHLSAIPLQVEWNSSGGFDQLWTLIYFCGSKLWVKMFKKGKNVKMHMLILHIYIYYYLF